MRYPASEKLEIIRLVEGSHLPTTRMLDKLGIPKTTFYRWYDRYLSGGPEALEDRSPRPSRVWNRILKRCARRSRAWPLWKVNCLRAELAVSFTDTEKYFVSEASVYRILKSYDLITSPAYVVLSAADEFKDKTTRPNELWQTDFTYLKIIGWGWFYLSTILGDYSRYIIAWKLCTTMKTEDVTDTLDLALQASGCDQATVPHKPRLLSDNGSTYISGDLADWLDEPKMSHVRGAPYHPQTRARSSVGTKPSRTASCWKITICRATSSSKSMPSLITTTTTATTRACKTLTPADVYFGRGQTILKQSERIKRKTIETRRLLHRKSAA